MEFRGDMDKVVSEEANDEVELPKGIDISAGGDATGRHSMNK